jgi:Co/Zn/Cd efflux system component
MTLMTPFAGYVVGSLALIADAYHMLNDVVSLVIALYAIKVRFSPCIFCDFMSTR